MKKLLSIFSGVLFLLLCAVAFIAFKFVTVENGQYAYQDGQLMAIPDEGYRFDSWSGGDGDAKATLSKILFEKPSFVPVQLELPIIQIETENNKKIVSKEEYLKCTVSLSADEENSFRGVTGKIKGRGNSTFGLDKKPYKIKFDEKISLLGEDKAKEWTLIANHMDYSLLRNYIAYTVGTALELEYTTSANFVDVYVNGEYMGVYLICEQIEVGKSRVNIEDSLEAEETGYLLELDARAPAEGVLGVDYFYSNAGAQPYAIKSPDTEDEKFTTERVSYIQQYINDSYNALLGTDYSEVCRYIDVDTFVNGYILDELLKTTDVGFSSFYLYKDAGKKLCRGPIWDYDLAIGNSVVADAVSTESIYAGAVNPWYARLLTFPEFRSAVGARLSEMNEVITRTIDNAFSLSDSYKNSFLRNFSKWDILGKYSMDYTSREVCEIETFDGQLAYLKKWLYKSLAYLNECYVK